MRTFLTSYFYYSRGERVGVMLLAGLSLSVLMFTKMNSLMNRQKNEITDFSAFEQEIATFTSQQASDTEGPSFAVQNNDATLFPFNPNNASQEDLVRLGLSPRVATTLIHFREKGGKFFKKEDFKKIYGVKPTDYERLASYIELENTGGFTPRNFNTPPQYNRVNNGAKTPEIHIELKSFDPNNATENDLLGLGLDEKTVKILLKYREKGGYFRTKEDLKKVYGLSDIDFLRINQYVQITEKQPIASESPKNGQNNDITKKTGGVVSSAIDLNKSNLEDFLVLRGIGRTFATRIIEHRERLGGFSSLNQLKEVYGLPDSTLRFIIPLLRLSTSPHRKIQVNKSSVEELVHPYLSKKQAEAMVRYRVNHGSFKNTDDLKKTGVFTDIMIEKLQPYLDF
jgi:competence protein ComEA